MIMELRQILAIPVLATLAAFGAPDVRAATYIDDLGSFSFAHSACGGLPLVEFFSCLSPLAPTVTETALANLRRDDFL